MKKVFIIAISFLLISCFTEPKKMEEKVSKIENVIIEKEIAEDKDTLPSQIESSINGEDYAKSITVKTFDSKCKIYNHYDGCGSYFASTKEDFYAGDKNVFYGTLLGKEGAEIELLINDKIEKLIFVEKEKADFKVYYKYANSEHEATMELKKRR